MMTYKLLITNENGVKIYARIDEDGLCRLTCIAENPEFQNYIKNGGELQDADGKTMTANKAKEFVATLP
jgi:hypothetical protein